MSNVEQRLRNALDARAALVQPEDLSLSPVLEPTFEDPTRWWQRPGAYLFVAAVAVIVIALPLLALASSGGDDRDRDGDVANSPSGQQTMTDPVPSVFKVAAGDVDGDDEPDAIRVTHADGDGDDAWAIEVDLSATDETAVFDETGPVVTGIALVETADVDGRAGEEILAVVDPTVDAVRRFAPLAISLRDGELVQVIDHDFPRDDADWRTHWWVNDGELWWWRSQATVEPEATEPFAVEALRFPHAARLTAEPAGEYCVRPGEPERLLACGGDQGPEQPDGDDSEPTGQVESDPWWEEPVEGLPARWDVEGSYPGSFASDVDGDGAPDEVTLDGSELVVVTGGAESRVAVEGPDPQVEGVVRLSGSDNPVILVHTTEGTAGTTYVSWKAYAFVDGELTRLSTVPLAPRFGSEYSNLSPDDGGHPSVRTWLAGDDALHGMDYLDRAEVEGPGGETVWAYLVRVRSWYVDGRTLRATTPRQACIAPAVGMQISECPDGL